MILQLDPDDDEEEDRRKRELEAPFADDVAAALNTQRDALIPSDATEDTLYAAAARVDETSEPVRDVLRRNLLAGADLGVRMSLTQLEGVGLGFDYTLAHAQAAEWANAYAFDLVSRLNDTTRRRLQSAIDQWFREATTIADLREELTPLFGEVRAQIIAQTETTRAAAEGTRISYIQSGVVRKIIVKTAVDDRVCPICGPLHNTRHSLESGVPDLGFPPFHIGCRCWIAGVV